MHVSFCNWYQHISKHGQSLTERCKVHAEQDTLSLSLITAGSPLFNSILFYCGTRTYRRHAGARQRAAPVKTVFCPTDTPRGSARPPPLSGTERRRPAKTSRPRLCVRAPPTPEEWLPTDNGKLTEHVQTNITRLCPFQWQKNINQFWWVFSCTKLCITH